MTTPAGPISAAAVKRIIAQWLTESGTTLMTLPTELPDGFDLRADGGIDSLGFLQLVAALEHRWGRSLDFDALAPEDLLIVGRLAGLVAKQIAADHRPGAEAHHD